MDEWFAYPWTIERAREGSIIPRVRGKGWTNFGKGSTYPSVWEMAGDWRKGVFLLQSQGKEFD